MPRWGPLASHDSLPGACGAPWELPRDSAKNVTMCNNRSGGLSTSRFFMVYRGKYINAGFRHFLGCFYTLTTTPPLDSFKTCSSSSTTWPSKRQTCTCHASPSPPKVSTRRVTHVMNIVCCWISSFGAWPIVRLFHVCVCAVTVGGDLDSRVDVMNAKVRVRRNALKL